jgi:hypothetical protein
VRYSADRSKLPPPYFPYPVNPDSPNLSEALKQIAKKQSEVIKQWQTAQYGYVHVLVPSTFDVSEDYNNDNQNKKTEALVAYARGHGVKLSVGDFDAMTNRSTGSLWRITELGKWPKDQRGYFEAAQDPEALEAMAQRVMAESLDFMDLSTLGAAASRTWRRCRCAWPTTCASRTS